MGASKNRVFKMGPQETGFSRRASKNGFSRWWPLKPVFMLAASKPIFHDGGL